MPISSRCCSRLRAQQFGVSAVGGCSGPPWNRPQCGCLCICGLISSLAAMSAASSDCSLALWISDIFVVVMMFVGHLSPSPAIFLDRWSSFVGKDVMLFDIRLSSFCTGLSSFYLISTTTALNPQPMTPWNQDAERASVPQNLGSRNPKRLPGDHNQVVIQVESMPEQHGRWKWYFWAS